MAKVARPSMKIGVFHGTHLSLRTNLCRISLSARAALLLSHFKRFSTTFVHRTHGRTMPAALTGYELRGSGSNNYTKYLARSLALAGNHVHIICRDSSPSDYRPWLGACFRYSADSSRVALWEMDADAPQDARIAAAGGSATMHVLPLGRLAPVYQTDMKVRCASPRAL